MPFMRNGYDPEAHGALCSKCPLNGQVVVPPEGPQDPLLTIVGEGPGYQEVKQQRPFVGPSGAALQEICNELGIRREQVWITNTMLCRCEVPGMSGKKKYDVNTYMAWLKVENKRRKQISKSTGQPYEPIMSPAECCAARLYGELARIEDLARKRNNPNGAVVMPLGNYALYALTSERGIMKYRGSPIKLTQFDPGPSMSDPSATE